MYTHIQTTWGCCQSMSGSAPRGIQDSVCRAQSLSKSLPPSHSTCGMNEIKSWRFWIAHLKQLRSISGYIRFVIINKDNIFKGTKWWHHARSSAALRAHWYFNFLLVLREVDRVEASFSVLGTDRGSRGPGGYHSRDPRAPAATNYCPVRPWLSSVKTSYLSRKIVEFRIRPRIRHRLFLFHLYIRVWVALTRSWTVSENRGELSEKQESTSWTSTRVKYT